METWFANNWWWLWAIVAAVALLAYRVHARGGNESLVVRVLYTIAPVLDPGSEERKRMTPLAFALMGAGMIIVVVAFVMVEALNR